MSKNKYYNIGIAPFNKLVEEQPSFEGNFKAVDRIISRMAIQHASTVEKFGYSYSLDLIFIREISKYYSAITKFPINMIESFIPMISKISSGDNSNDTPFMRERVIIYPTFEHGIKGDAIAHIPCTESFVIDKNDILFRLSEVKDYEPVVIGDFKDVYTTLDRIVIYKSYCNENN